MDASKASHYGYTEQHATASAAIIEKGHSSPEMLTKYEKIFYKTRKNIYYLSKFLIFLKVNPNHFQSNNIFLLD